MTTRRSCLLSAVWLGLILCAWPTHSQTPAPASSSDRILQQELKQQQIQRTTARVSEQLGGIIEEFERNAIVGEDVRVLKAITRACV